MQICLIQFEFQTEIERRNRIFENVIMIVWSVTRAYWMWSVNFKCFLNDNSTFSSPWLSVVFFITNSMTNFAVEEWQSFKFFDELAIRACRLVNSVFHLTFNEKVTHKIAGIMHPFVRHSWWNNARSWMLARRRGILAMKSIQRGFLQLEFQLIRTDHLI